MLTDPADLRPQRRQPFQPPPPKGSEAERPRVFCGLDLGRRQDYSCFTALEQLPLAADPAHGPTYKDPGRKQHHYLLRGIKRWDLGTAYPQVKDEVIRKFCGPPLAGGVLAVDQTGVGEAWVQQLMRDLRDPVACPTCAGAGTVRASPTTGPRPETPQHRTTCDWCGGAGKVKPRVSVRPVWITGGKGWRPDGPGFSVAKKELVSVLVVLVEGGRLKTPSEGQCPEVRHLMDELNNFKVKITEARNESFEAWRDREHDDIVLSVACACFVAERGMQQIWVR